MARSSDTPRFELMINGERIGIAGMESLGVLCASVEWVKRSPDAVPEHAANHPQFDLTEWIDGKCRVRLGGLDSTARQHVDWCYRELAMGDEITIRILPPGEIDDPQHSRSEDEVRADCMEADEEPSE